MPKVVEIKPSRRPAELRHLSARVKDANQSRRLMSIAAALAGMSRSEAAKIGGMDRQTLRDWAHRFNERGPEGPTDNWRRSVPRRLSEAQQQELAALVETGPDRAVHGVLRWRRVDLHQVIAERYGVVYHKRTIEAFKKLRAHARSPCRPHSAQEAHRCLVPG
jgi:transposase